VYLIYKTREFIGDERCSDGKSVVIGYSEKEKDAKEYKDKMNKTAYSYQYRITKLNKIG